MTVFDQQGRPEPPQGGDEAGILIGFLEFHRATFEWKTRGLDSAGLNATHPPSTMTLGGMMKHLALVEDSWFGEWVLGHAPQPPWDTVDWDADRDWEWHTAGDDSPDYLRSLWQSQVDRSRTATAQALAEGGLDRPTVRHRRDGTTFSLRWILVHMIEEYSRHNGHADLLRESIDGQTGE